MRRTLLTLSEVQRLELLALRDHHPKPSRRGQAAALLKVADGWPAAHVAAFGLLRPRDPETVAAWVHRYLHGGFAALAVGPGRGRKPAFSLGGPLHGPGRCSIARRAAPLAPIVRP